MTTLASRLNEIVALAAADDLAEAVVHRPIIGEMMAAALATYSAARRPCCFQLESSIGKPHPQSLAESRRRKHE